MINILEAHEMSSKAVVLLRGTVKEVCFDNLLISKNKINFGKMSISQMLVLGRYSKMSD